MQPYAFETVERMWDYACRRWEECALTSIARKPRFTVALSGGDTPIEFYKILSKKENLPWEKTHIFQVDEKFVPRTDKDNNFSMIKRELLEKINLKKNNIHPIDVNPRLAGDSAIKYEKSLRKFFKCTKNDHPAFDLIILGIGAEGHTASLFPGSKSIYEKRNSVIALDDKELNHTRITLTIPVFNKASNILFLVKGKGKSTIVKKIVENKTKDLPSSMIVPEAGTVELLMDSDAKGDLMI